ncbi:MAG: tetratricopeptide repeat protein, partial [Tepidisphaeraceae bacterium]
MRTDAPERAWGCVGWALMLFLFLAVSAGADDAVVRRASELMKNRQYNDAIKVLSEEVKGKPDEAAARQHLMLGECHYLLKQYEEARGYFAKAARNAADDADKAVAEYRLACVAFRLKETNSAGERIDAFVTRRPGDARLGVLLVFKMRLLAEKGAAAEREMVALHDRIVGEARKYGAAAAMESDEVLCEFYRSIGQEDKAIGLYGRIVNNYRRLIADLEKEKQPVPPSYELTHDNAALQLGLINLEKKQYGEATKWLENVTYDAELKLRAKLLLSKMAYDKGDYAQVIARLTEKNLLAEMSDGPTKWDVCLLLGLAERSKPDSNAGKVEEWLKQVGQQARGYGQAQGVLGDLYREKGLQEEALRAYAAAMAVPDHAASATYWTAAIYLERADKEPDKAKATELTKKATEMLGRVLQAYPMTSSAKLAKDKLAELAKKGVDVGAAAGADEMLKAWERLAKDKPGGADAAQALAQLVRVHAKIVVDEKTKKPSKGPNYEAMAAVADRLLDEKVYKGDGLGEAGWRALRCEVLYTRALAELASMNPSKELEAVGAVYVKHPSADAAAEWLRESRKLVEPKQLEMVKGIELAMLEALFKSEKPENHEKAEKRFAELEADYGSDPRFAKLSLDLAEFYKSTGRFVEAADQYAGAARRGRDLPAEDAVKLWYAAGTLYSRAAYEMQQKKSQRDYGVYLYPKETISFGT